MRVIRTEAHSPEGTHTQALIFSHNTANKRRGRRREGGGGRRREEEGGEGGGRKVESVPDVRSVARSSDGRVKGGGDRVCGGGEEVKFKTVVLKS